MRPILIAIIILATAAPADAGIFSRWFKPRQTSVCVGGKCAVPQAGVKFRKECVGGSCRLVPVK